MKNRKLVQGMVLSIAGAALVGGLAAWSAPPGTPRHGWTHGELRVPLSGVPDMAFVQSDDVEVLEAPRDFYGSATQLKLYYLDRLATAGWELLEVDQTQRDWIYLMRRPERYP
jgi:hypothetical protein